MEKDKKPSPSIAYTDETDKKEISKRPTVPKPIKKPLDIPQLQSEEKAKKKQEIVKPPQVRTSKINLTNRRMNVPVNLREKGMKTCEELTSKDTHYVFTFGYTGSGKSTVLAALVLYMRLALTAIPDPDSKGKGVSKVGRMVRELRKGKFPEGTTPNEVLEYDVSLPTKNGEEVNLTFIEMAGENLIAFDPSREGKEIIDAIDVYLRCPDISISFLLIGDYQKLARKNNAAEEDDEDQDDLLFNFLARLVRRGIDTSKVGLILSKFDLAYKEDSLQKVIQTYMNQTESFLKSKHIETPKVFPFTIGEVNEEIVKVNPHAEGAIKSIELGDCEPIVKWIIQDLGNQNDNKTSWFDLFF